MTNKSARTILMETCCFGCEVWKEDEKECSGCEIKEATKMAAKALKQQSTFEQVKWERDVAIAQLKENGLSLGELRKSDWIPITYHVGTEKEREEYGISEGMFYLFDCIMPDDEEEILVCYKNGCVDKDICYIGAEYSLDSGWNWIADVIAWQPLPEPYKEREEK